MVEVLLAIVILGIAGVALLLGFATSITTSAQHRNLATLDASAREASNQVISQVQQAGNNAFGPGNCANGTTYKPTWNLSGSFTVTNYTVQYWNGSTFVSNATLNTSPNKCTGYEPQLWTVSIGSGSYNTNVSTVIYDPQAPPVSGGSTPYKLVFLQPTSTGTGTINAAVSPQPIVAVEDINGNIVYSDASSVTLTASGGPGTLSNNCAGVENTGIISFSGCSFSAAGTYSLTGTDSNPTLQKATGASYTISTAPPAKVVFTSSTFTQTASTSSGPSLITVQEQDAFGNADPGALTVNLTSSSPTGFFTTSSGSTTPVTSVSILAGQSSVSFYYADTKAGSPTLSAGASGLQTGTQTETITGAAPTHVVITPTPGSASVSATTNIALGLQLVDQFGNNTTSVGTTTLTLSSASAKGFFNATNGHSGTLGATANVSFGPGVGNVTEYYGDETVASPTITAKNGAATWGTTTVTITVGAPTTITLNSGSGQSALVNTSFTNPLVATVTDAFGNLVPGASVTFSGPTTGASETFATGGNCSSNPHTYSCVVTTGSNGQVTTSTFTANTTAGGPYNISASAPGTNTVNFTETNNPGAATQVVITPTPGSVGASATTNVKLGLQLVDQYGNNTTSVGTTTLTLSSASAKGFFATTNGASGTLGATANVTFGPGVGTATEYYGDEKASASTLITAKNGVATWGTATVAITAQTSNDTMSIVQGNNQSATVNSAFGTALEVAIVDQFANPVPGVNVTFSAPATLASGTFAACSGGNPQTYQCVVATNAAGQATASTYTANTKSGGPYNVTTVAAGVAAPSTFSETNNPGTATQVVITPTPGSASASATTNIALGLQLVDQFGNNTTSTGTTTLTLSSASAKGFFATTNGASGTLGATANVTFGPRRRDRHRVLRGREGLGLHPHHGQERGGHLGHRDGGHHRRNGHPGRHHPHPGLGRRVGHHQHRAGPPARGPVRQQHHERGHHDADAEHQLGQGLLRHHQRRQRDPRRHGERHLRPRGRDGHRVLRGRGGGHAYHHGQERGQPPGAPRR